MKKWNLSNRVQRMLLRMAAVLPPTILILSNIFLFGPFTIYQGNSSEFAVSFISIIRYFFTPSLILVSILCAASLLLPEKHHRRYVSVLFVVGILIWLQGNILVWDYGLFGSGDIDWSQNVWHGWVDGPLWIMLLIVAFLFYKQIYRIAIFTIIILFSLQLMYLIFVSVQTSETRKEKEEYSLLTFSKPPEEIFQFSSKQNVIHIILDEFQSTLFEEIIEKDVDYYYSALEGFTFFKETTGSFPTTILSIPAILSGQNYKNDIPMRKFIDTVLEGRSIPNILYDSGYEVDITHVGSTYNNGKGQYSNSYLISVPYGVTKQQYERFNSASTLGLVLFRHAPHFLKKAIYNRQVWLPILNVQKRGGKHYQAARHFAHKAFLQDLIDNMSVNRDKPVYKFIHLLTTHWPAVLNENCEYAGELLPFTWENIEIQAECSLNHIIEFLNQLKVTGIYESSLIIINADHGYWHVADSINHVKLSNLDNQPGGGITSDKEQFGKIVAPALPLMAIKPPYRKGPLSISKAQTMLTDIPTTISSILNLNEKFDGRSVFEIDTNEVRERRFHHYDTIQNVDEVFYNHFDELIIKGSVFDRASWQLGVTYHSPDSSYQTEKINFGTKEGSRFLRFGWSDNEKHTKERLTYNWALGSSASIFLSLPKNEAVRLTANVKTLKFNKPQCVTVKVDNKEIGIWKLSPNRGWEKYSVLIDADENRANVSVVEFIFSQHLEKDGKRQLAVLFESITLSEA